MDNQIMNDISFLVWDKTEQQVYTQSCSQIGRKRWEHAWHMLAFEVWNQVRDQVQVQTLGELKDDLNEC